MKREFIFVLLLLFVFSGCSTMQRGTMNTGGYNDAQVKMAHLERKLNLRNQEVEELRLEIAELNKEISTYASKPKLADLVDEDESQMFVQPQETPSKDASREAKYIRVPVDAKEVQEALKNAGYYKGKIDGKFGSGSQKSVIEFQQDHNMKVDGIVGKQTWAQLKTYLN